MWEVFYIDSLLRYRVACEFKTRKAAKQFCEQHPGHGFRNAAAWRTM
jgi:hypothetical protein